jgi:hypothetical protein
MPRPLQAGSRRHHRGALLRTGEVGGSPEVYEKINPETGRGVVCLFCSAPGTYTYITENAVVPGRHWTNDAQNVTLTPGPTDRVRLDARFQTEGAKIVFFGAEHT